MKCLYCGKEIHDDASEEEKKTQWHKQCVHAFFGMEHLPNIDISEQNLEEMVRKSTGKGTTVTGVQKKLSLHYDPVSMRLTLIGEPAGYILKPGSEQYPYICEFEDAGMRICEAAGIRNVNHALIITDQSYAYITRRADRIISDDGIAYQKLAMEDFCQLSGRLTENKYQGSAESCGKVIRRYSSRYGTDLSEFFMRLIMSFMIGNSDMHNKNYSLIETEPGNRTFILSPAYDLLPVNLILPEDQEESALTVNGKKKHLHRNDFLKCAEGAGLNRRAAEKMIDMLCSRKEAYFKAAQESFLPVTEQGKLVSLMGERISRLASH